MRKLLFCLLFIWVITLIFFDPVDSVKGMKGKAKFTRTKPAARAFTYFRRFRERNNAVGTENNSEFDMFVRLMIKSAGTIFFRSTLLIILEQFLMRLYNYNPAENKPRPRVLCSVIGIALTFMIIWTRFWSATLTGSTDGSLIPGIGYGPKSYLTTLQENVDLVKTLTKTLKEGIESIRNSGIPITEETLNEQVKQLTTYTLNKLPEDMKFYYKNRISFTGRFYAALTVTQLLLFLSRMLSTSLIWYAILGTLVMFIYYCIQYAQETESVVAVYVKTNALFIATPLMILFAILAGYSTLEAIKKDLNISFFYNTGFFIFGAYYCAYILTERVVGYNDDVLEFAEYESRSFSRQYLRRYWLLFLASFCFNIFAFVDIYADIFNSAKFIEKIIFYDI